jgi:uncharacterized protein (TIGR02391 family)
MRSRKITTDVRDRIRSLAEVLADFLPLTSPSRHTITFTTIFAESKVSKHLADIPKKKALQQALEQIFRHHPRLPSLLIRKIIPAAVSYRRYKRRPLKKAELDRLNACLESLDIHMQNEFAKIQLDETLPDIQVPPPELMRRLENHPLVSEVSSEPLDLFRNGHFNESVRKATEKFEVNVQKRSSMNDIGKDLMAKAFKLDNPKIKLNSLQSENEKAIQEGFQLMTMGMMRAIRNVFSHGDETQRRPEEAYEMLLFINWLFRQLKEQHRG